MQNHKRKFNKNRELHTVKSSDAIPVICFLLFSGEKNSALVLVR